MEKERKLTFLHRLTHFEFWPFQIFYFPMMLYGFWLALRSGSLSYFTAANPGLKYGGAFDMSKADSLRQISPAYIPGFVLVRDPQEFSPVVEGHIRKTLGYPLIAKPDTGERGKGVEMIRDAEELSAYLSATSNPVILQQFVSQPKEAGILFYKMPDGSGKGITSVVLRDFLEITGNGRDTLAVLAGMRERTRNRMDYLKRRFMKEWEEIVPEGEKIILEPIGNHNRGTVFRNGNHLITTELVDAIDKITATIDGFFYGRLDVKYDSDEGLKKGKGITVLEVNGVNSEPAHIYHPGTPLLYAYKVILRHMNLIRKIANINHRQFGIAYSPWKTMFRDLLRHGRSRDKISRLYIEEKVRHIQKQRI